MSYKVSLVVRRYTGKNAQKIANYHMEIDIANRIEDWLNNKLRLDQAGSPRTFEYFTIAQELELERDVVKKILMHNRGGSNGITVGQLLQTD
jgi:hypothetical protein